MEHQVIALIIASSEPLREGLYTLLIAIPAITQVRYAENAAALDSLSRTVIPAVIVLECDPSAQDMSATLRQIKAIWPATPCIVLVDSDQQTPALQAAGADILFLKGVLAARLFVTIADLLM